MIIYKAITKVYIMIREKITAHMKSAMQAKEKETLATIRLIMAGIKDADINARTEETENVPVDDNEVIRLLQAMIKQRKDSIEMYIKGDRQDLADKEQAEILVIKEFLPEQLSPEELEKAVQETISELNAESIKDMGKIMNALREKYAGKMDFGDASTVAKKILL